VSRMVDQAERNRQVRRTSWVGMAANVTLFAFKLTAGILGHSQAVVADAFHSLTDLGSDIALLIGVNYWSEPPDVCHPYGHGRIEMLVSLGLAASLGGAGVFLACHSLVSLRQPDHAVPGPAALVAALTSIVIKEALYRWTVHIGNRVKSPALIANAWHHRSDAFSSIPPALAIGAALVSPVWSFTDHIGAVLVAMLILQAAWKIGTTSIASLVDRGAPEATLEEIDRLARSVKGVQCLHAVRTRHLGSGWGVDLHVLVHEDLTVRAGHDVAERVKEELYERGPNITDVVVHIEPFEELGLTETHVGLDSTHYLRR